MYELVLVYSTWNKFELIDYKLCEIFFLPYLIANLIAIHLIASTLINKFLPIFILVSVFFFFFIYKLYVRIGSLFGSHKLLLFLQNKKSKIVLSKDILHRYFVIASRVSKRKKGIARF